MLPLLLEKLPGHHESALSDVTDTPLHFPLLLAKAPILGSEGIYWISLGE